jgi:hypothetical protein
MKRFLLPMSFLLICMSSLAQTITIDSTLNSPNYIVGAAGTAPNTSKYHISEFIYTNSEIGNNNFITAGSAIQEVSFFIQTVGSPTNITNFKLYMRNIADTQNLTSGTYLPKKSLYTLVYNGALDANPVDGKVKVTLQTSFVRTAGNNLQILVERLDGISYPGFAFRCTQGNRSNTALLTARRYNSSTTLSSNPSLTASGFRPSIQFKHTYNLDASILSITNPTVSCYNSNQTIKVALSNQGLSEIPAGAVTVNLQVSGSNTYVGNVSNANAILVGEYELINFTGVNLNNPGQNLATASVVYSSDQNAINDVSSSSSSTSSVLSVFPISEDFESGASSSSFPNTELLAGNLNLWSLQTGDYTSYGTLSPRSTGSSYYLFDCYSGSASYGFTSRLFSNCLTLPVPFSLNSVVSTLSFYMSHDNEVFTSNDSLFVCISTNRGATWTRIAGYQRYDATFATPGWKNELVDISAYNAQTIQIGFEGVSDYGNVFGLDDINISYSGIVPVTMLSFDAVRNGKTNNLTWTTTNEINSSKFEIERSTNGINYGSIGSVNAIGNGASKQSYRFMDVNPAKGNNYYRIKSIDVDNSFKLSEIRNVKNLGFVEMMINPNPVASTMNISLEAEETEKATIVITDLSGRKVYNGKTNVIAGNNNIPVNVNNLTKGIYLVTLQLSGETLIKKITKL